MSHQNTIIHVKGFILYQQLHPYTLQIFHIIRGYNHRDLKYAIVNGCYYCFSSVSVFIDTYCWLYVHLSNLCLPRFQSITFTFCSCPLFITNHFSFSHLGFSSATLISIKYVVRADHTSQGQSIWRKEEREETLPNYM